jgi:aspartyl-tRNA(Asn)/glutamyl-tRNA(Gln) amidotransferase subunit A
MSAAGPSVTDNAFLTIAELAPQIRNGRLSPEALAEAALDRLERYGPKLNAIATTLRERARTRAHAAAVEIKAGRYRGPLHGVPWGAKDLLAVAGAPTEWGAAPCRGQTFDHDATVVRRLDDAGAVLTAKLAMVEFAGCLGYRFPDASVTGPGRNPWDPGRWTGGSSSGSGAAVAAGLVPFAIGTETWGSILCPSAFCGITGVRPTYGRVSRAGGMVGAFTFDKIGPLARSAADCRTVLELIAGLDPNDPTSADESPKLPRSRRDARGVRGALYEPDWEKTKGVEPEVRERFHAAVEVLKRLGLSLEKATLPTAPAGEVGGLLITAEALSTFEKFYRDGSVRRLKDPYAPYQMELNAPLSGADVVKAWRVRRLVQEQTREFFERYDVIVTPNFLSVAPPVEMDLYKALPYGDPIGALGATCGLPAIALPCGLGAHDMPVGFQIVGAPWDEALLCDLGEAFQAKTTHHLEHPPGYGV